MRELLLHRAANRALVRKCSIRYVAAYRADVVCGFPLLHHVAHRFFIELCMNLFHILALTEMKYCRGSSLPLPPV